MIHTINSQDAFEQFLRIECHPGQVLVVQFSAVWCGPCKKISPHIETIVSKYETIQFIKIDLDEAEQEGWEWAMVSAVPTFRILSVVEEKNKHTFRVVDEWCDSNVDVLRQHLSPYLTQQ
jgi:thiol-disulfide isomerase/thioredoxin